MKNIKTLFLFQVKHNLKSNLTWATVLFGIMSMYMFFFSTMQEMAQVKFEMLPQEYLQLMGVDDIAEMGNYVTYFGMIFNILSIIMAVYAVSLGVNLLLKEEKNKTIEYLYSLEITRTQIYIAKVFTAFISVIVVVVATGLAGMIFGYAVGAETFQAVDVMAIIKITGTIPFLFVALGIFLSSASAKHASVGLGCGIVMLTYLLGYLGKILEDKAKFLKFFSPFELLSPSNAVALENETLIAFGVITSLTVLLIVCGNFFFVRRDYNL